MTIDEFLAQLDELAGAAEAAFEAATTEEAEKSKPVYGKSGKRYRRAL